MRILAIDSSGLVASAAVSENDRILAEFNINNKKTHSQTLLPMIEDIFKILGEDVSTIDAVAVSKGPGSFTGLRIGSATAKGIALALKKPMIEISSLEAMAFQIYGTGGLICPMMDARRGQVYTALFENGPEGFVRIKNDSAASVEELAEEINSFGKAAVLLGDGVDAYTGLLKEKLTVSYYEAPAFQNRQRAAALAVLAGKYAAEGSFVDADLHRPEYLRMSQAERERMEKEKNA